jgi:predicted enzyme related to lactoylglutathione lyase
MPTVYHFDIPVDDANRAQQFYKNVFGWDMKKVESQVEPKVELWMCETVDENGKKGIKVDKVPLRRQDDSSGLIFFLSSFGVLIFKRSH